MCRFDCKVRRHAPSLRSAADARRRPAIAGARGRAARRARRRRGGVDAAVSSGCAYWMSHTSTTSSCTPIRKWQFRYVPVGLAVRPYDVRYASFYY
jgi:hypothetical protein